MTLGVVKSTLLENSLESLLVEWESTHESGPVVISTTNYNITIDSVLSENKELSISFRIGSK